MWGLGSNIKGKTVERFDADRRVTKDAWLKVRSQLRQQGYEHEEELSKKDERIEELNALFASKDKMVLKLEKELEQKESLISEQREHADDLLDKKDALLKKLEKIEARERKVRQELTDSVDETAMYQSVASAFADVLRKIEVDFDDAEIIPDMSEGIRTLVSLLRSGQTDNLDLHLPVIRSALNNYRAEKLLVDLNVPIDKQPKE